MMNILIIGTGVIGCTYGYIFEKSGHRVSHYIRDEKRKLYPQIINVSLLDGRCKRIEKKNDIYNIKPNTDRHFDLIVLSVPNYQLQKAIRDINYSEITGTLLLFCNIWDNKEQIDEIMQGKSYIFGFPAGGGAFNNDQSLLNCVLFSQIHLEKKVNTTIPNYDSVIEVFRTSNFSIACPYDMLQWIWIHIAINMGLLNVIIDNGGMEDSDAALKKVISSYVELKRGIKKIRLYIRIVQKRGVKLRYFLSEIILFFLPLNICTRIVKREFEKNILSREIMLLHNNKKDLLYQYQKFIEMEKITSL